MAQHRPFPRSARPGDVFQDILCGSEKERATIGVELATMAKTNPEVITRSPTPSTGAEYRHLGRAALERATRPGITEEQYMA